ncbi:alpha/beta fold hydrolase [Streptomyces aurantiacus]|uniref:Putative Methylesterase 8 n=1 Tax=Streptomyces aurantiacus JA 4570 TaxID=1286094 RepID=S3ZNR9_9ACTN|nr:alpha/beta fold hydrolase [Streptomyces aurantiacus]EPH44444.1 putative Methylesterase 8 [Streptomyces aurantiacus JA 4570]
MTTFVLVHGTWLGGWVWDRVATPLRRRGHTVLTPTLPGLAERRAEARPDTGLETHVSDLVRYVRDVDRPVVMVGHSYGGIVAQGAAARLGEQVRHLVFLDAFLAEPGESAFDLLPWLVDFFAPVSPDLPWLAAPLPFDSLTVSDAGDRAWLAGAVTPMPLATHREPARDAPSPRPSSYWFCAARPMMADMLPRARARGMDVVELDTAHVPMVTHPHLLVERLHTTLPEYEPRPAS